MTGRLALLSVLLVADVASARDLPRGEDRPDPHGDPDACTACHAPAVGDEGAGALLAITQTCRGCHPTADMHPVQVAPDRVAVPQQFPLDDGLLSCASCHVEPAHTPEVEVPRPYHRGGPYPDVRQLCYSCHERSEYTRTDPHHPDNVQDRDDPTCAACHSGPPEEGAAPADANLRFPTSESCKTCHEGEVHQGVSSHVGKKLGPDALATLPSTVPLGEDATVQCFSCHDVHGVVPGQEARVAHRWTSQRPLAEELRASAIAKEWADLVPAEAIWPGTVVTPGHPPLLTLPIADGTLCRACHGDGP